jgi:hypothetical protein
VYDKGRARARAVVGSGAAVLIKLLPRILTANAAIVVAVVVSV